MGKAQFRVGSLRVLGGKVFRAPRCHVPGESGKGVQAEQVLGLTQFRVSSFKSLSKFWQFVDEARRVPLESSSEVL